MSVDLTIMNADELQDLVSKAQEILSEKSDEIEKQRLAKLEEKGVLNDLRAEYKALVKEYEKFDGKTTVTVNIPVKFTVHRSSCLEPSEIADYEEINEYDLFSVDVEAELASGGDFTRDQKAALKSALENLNDWACEDIQKLVPLTDVKDFVKRVNKFIKVCQKHEVSTENLQ